MPASWTDINPEVDTEADSVLELEQRTLELRKHQTGVAPVEQQIRVRTDVTPWVVEAYVKIDAGAADWHPIGVLDRLSTDLNLDGTTDQDRAICYQIKGARIENVADLAVAALNNKGLLQFRTSDGELYVADVGVSGGNKGLLSVTPAASYDTVELPLEGDVGNDATHPPTKQAKGALEGWLFDAVNEKRTFAFVMPKNWQGASDAKLRLSQVLNQGEVAGDDIEWSGEIRTVIPAQENVLKAATALVDVSTDIGADVDGVDDGGFHRSDLTLDFDDPDNPLSAGALVLVTIWRKTVGGAGKVSGVVVFRAELLYAQKPRHERA